MSRMLTGVRNWLGDVLGELLNLFESDEGEDDNVFVGYYAKGPYAADAGHIFALALRRRGVVPVLMMPVSNNRHVVYDPEIWANPVVAHILGGAQFSLGLDIDIVMSSAKTARPLPERFHGIVGVRTGIPIREYVATVCIYTQDGKFTSSHVMRRPLAYQVATRTSPLLNEHALSELLHCVADGVRTKEACAGTTMRVASYIHAV